MAFVSAAAAAVAAAAGSAVTGAMAVQSCGGGGAASGALRPVSASIRVGLPASAGAGQCGYESTRGGSDDWWSTGRTTRSDDGETALRRLVRSGSEELPNVTGRFFGARDGGKPRHVGRSTRTIGHE